MKELCKNTKKRTVDIINDWLLTMRKVLLRVGGFSRTSFGLRAVNGWITDQGRFKWFRRVFRNMVLHCVAESL